MIVNVPPLKISNISNIMKNTSCQREVTDRRGRAKEGS
jgi:hypothetical protein